MEVNHEGTFQLQTGQAVGYSKLPLALTGRTHAGTRIILLVQDLNIRLVNAVTGELLRDLTLNPNRDYQPRNTSEK